MKVRSLPLFVKEVIAGFHQAGIATVMITGDQRYRLCQEVLLGIGGVRMLRALGYDTIARFHLNEGHASLLTLELLDEELHKAGRPALLPDDIDAVRGRCLFITHTPVPAGHDQFPLERNYCYCDCCATARPTVSRTWATGNGLKIYSKTHRRAPSSTASSEA
jgi:hypothetical protein